MARIFETTNYARFKNLIGNRKINLLHVERLKESFAKKYLVSPIIVNHNHEIIDGQHRFLAAKHLKLPIKYIIVKDYGLDEVKTLNTNNEGWKKVDYLKAFCDLGNPEYLKMREFMQTYPEFGIRVSEQILSNTTFGVNNNSLFLAPKDGKARYTHRKVFEEGGFVVKNIEIAYENADKIMAIKPYYKGFNRSIFVAAMIGIFAHPNYNHNQLIHKLSKNPNSLYDCSNIKQYRELIEEVYNYHSRNKVSLKY